MSTEGLSGVLPWAQARHIAATSAHPLPRSAARLDEAVGATLGADLVTLQDDPPSDSADVDGFAVCGPGPWLLDDLQRLASGWAAPIRRGTAVPHHCDAVIAIARASVRENARGQREVWMHDPLTDVPDERVRPDLGEGLARVGARSQAGHRVLGAGRPVTPSTIALAAQQGYDEITVVRPPVVGVLVLGSSLLDRGLPRNGRVRDALGAAVTSFVGELGARGNPALRAPDTYDLLVGEIDDANVDVLVTTGSTAPGPENHLRSALRDLNARWLVDGVSVSPGAQMLLARLVDGRFLIGLPGDPCAALAGLVTLATPLIASLRDDPAAGDPGRRSGILIEDIVPADYADDTALVPVRLEVSAAGTLAKPLAAAGAMGLSGWAAADAVAVVPPGAGYRGDVVALLDPYGRS